MLKRLEFEEKLTDKQKQELLSHYLGIMDGHYNTEYAFNRVLEILGLDKEFLQYYWDNYLDK